MKHYDLIIIGGGIVGTATAMKMQQRLAKARILLVEKEKSFGMHQTGHNSGVIHAGVYYRPGSLKADFCRRGLIATYEFCKKHNLPVEQCGKLLVATDEQEYQRMAALEKRCRDNQITVEGISGAELRRREPLINGIGALFVAATGITDYRNITRQMADNYRQSGGSICLGAEVSAIAEDERGVTLSVGSERIRGSYLLVCGGLMADRLAKMSGVSHDFRVIPFRGEYFRLPDSYNSRLNHLIYPIPDPELPFLGVHLTRMIDGSVTVGPNAVLGWKREGYGRLNILLKDVADIVSYPGTWRLLRGHFRTGLAELRDSAFKAGYLKRVRKYCEEVQLSDLQPYPAGIRAQAVLRDGSLVHDFLFGESERTLHVFNAPSPAATSALPIAEHLVERAVSNFGLEG